MKLLFYSLYFNGVAQGFTILHKNSQRSSVRYSSPPNGAAALENNDAWKAQKTEEATAFENTAVAVDSNELPVSPTEQQKSRNLLFLQSLGAITGRGEFATNDQRLAALESLQALQGIPSTSNIIGRWELVYSTTQLFRSSPFFMASRAVCATDRQAQQYNWFCDMHRKALAVSTIGAVRQIVSDDRLVSEFEVTAGAVPFVSSYSGGWPVTIDGAIVSSADIIQTNTNTDTISWSLWMDTVEIKGSNLPGIRQILDSGRVKLETRRLANVLEQTNYNTPRPLFVTTYLDDTFRISRDQDDNMFLYVKTSDSTKPTDYSGKESDLGLLALLGGFNDAVTQFYL
jgi:hypothetical protein